DTIGGAVAAAAAGVLAAGGLGQPGVLWGIASVLAPHVGFALVLAFPFATLRGRLREAIPLAAGTALAALAPAVAGPGGSEAAALAFSVGSTVPLAWATRRLWRTSDRTLLAAAGGAPLLALACVGAIGTPYAGSVGWTVAVLATAPWPSALAVDEARRRWFAGAVGRTVERAEGAYVRRDYERSVEEFDRAIHISTKAPVPADLPWHGKGAALTILGRYEEALRAIERALDINPMNEVAWLNKGNALTRMGRLVDALRSFNAAIKVNPAYEVAWNNKGNALARLGQYEEALRCYEKALDLDPAYRGAWVNKGFVLAKLGRFDEAAACADRALDLAGARPAGSG
ncbi:MAG: tetratricopeptide repeat protein, partial [Methanobacteriota archaeon]